jgi:hypothetical protein
VKRSKTKRRRDVRLQRIVDEVRSMETMLGKPGVDFVPNETAEIDVAERLIRAYLKKVPVCEASLVDLRELLVRLAIDPTLLLQIAAKKFLAGPEDDDGR